MLHDELLDMLFSVEVYSIDDVVDAARLTWQGCHGM